MNSTKLKLEYSICEQKGGIPVIIVAAGSSARMKGVNKLFMNIAGIPVIARTLAAFETCPEISKIIVVAAENSINDMQLICDRFMISKVSDIVCGGKNRHESVMNGISRLSEDEKKVLIHDGARPFVDGEIIRSVALSLNNYDCALCVTKINDTVKSVDQNGNVLSTLDRTTLYGAQTPQGVDVQKYILACENTTNIGAFTDDASIMESAGYKVCAVEGSVRNIKITTPEDIILAEAFIRGEIEKCE